MNSTIAPAPARAPTRYRRFPRPLLFLLAAIVLVAGAWTWRVLTVAPMVAASLASGTSRISPAFLEEGELDRLIAAYEQRVTDHTDALDYRTLGFLYLEKARGGGDVTRYRSARAALATAVDLFPSDPAARVGLASADYALHDFTAAAEEAQLVYDATGRPDALAILADAAAARGDYATGDSLLVVLAEQVGPLPPVLVRRAEAARLAGEADQAMVLAVEAAESGAESSNSRLRSWYQAFAAQMAFNLGHYDDGLVRAIAALDSDPLSLTARVTAARLTAATGDHDGAVALYESAAETFPDPALLAELGDLYLLLGRADDAEAAFAAVETAATLAAQAGIYDRAIAAYLADHGLDPPRAVEIAAADLERRQDVGAYDTLAWALLSAGRLDEAAAASARALSRGTLDARALYHAGLIAFARGDTVTARTQLMAALELSPAFQPLQAERATRTLAELG